MNYACLATKGPESHTKRNASDGSDYLINGANVPNGATN